MTQMPHHRWGNVLIFVVVVALAGTGLALKQRRYAGSINVDAVARASERITQVAAAHGWLPSVLPGDGREAFPWLGFSRSGCGRPLTVAIVKSTGELDDLARAIYGADTALIDAAGSEGISTPLIAPVIRLARNLAKTVVGGSTQPPVRLAIHPAPQHEPVSSCDGPPMAAWLEGDRPLTPSGRDHLAIPRKLKFHSGGTDA